MVMTNLQSHFTIGAKSFTAEQLIDLLKRYRLMPVLLREILIDEALTDIDLTSIEEQTILENLSKSQPDLQVSEILIGINPSQSWELRKAKIEKFKRQTWGNKVDDYFLSRKQQLDRAVYYLLRHKDQPVIQELFFRLQEGETTFTELVPQYSSGSEVHTKGLIGPVEMGKLNPILAHHLRNSHPGQLSPPIHLGDWWIIVEVVEWLPAQLDDNLRQKMLAECFEKWLNEKIHAEIRLHGYCP